MLDFTYSKKQLEQGAVVISSMQDLYISVLPDVTMILDFTYIKTSWNKEWVVISYMQDLYLLVSPDVTMMVDFTYSKKQLEQGAGCNFMQA